jgi:hypothetical protein
MSSRGATAGGPHQQMGLRMGAMASNRIVRAVSAAQVRYAWVIPILAIAGAVVCAGQILLWSSMGAWPFHDTATNWFAGRHVLEGTAVYTIDRTGFLSFLYAPPWAIIYAPLSLLPLQILAAGELVLQIIAFRFVAGSWKAAGLLAWLPFVPRAFVTGNIDFLVAAAILAGIRGYGWPIGLFAAAKISPALTLLGGTRRQWLEAIGTGVILLAITLPWLHLWGEWFANVVFGDPTGGESWLPLVVRAPVALLLIALRRPWALAAAAGLLTPAFHFHSVVLLFPAITLWLGARDGRVSPNDRSVVEVNPDHLASLSLRK